MPDKDISFSAPDPIKASVIPIKNTMKITLSIVSLTCALLIGGCATQNTALIDTSLSFGVSEGLKLAIKDPARRTAIANYIDVYATALRSVSGTPTPDQLLTTITQFIPASVRQDYPELQTIVYPLLTTFYGTAYSQFANNQAALYAQILRFATDLENGAAPYVSHH